MLVYGDYPEMHRDVLTPLLQHNRDNDVRLWLNAVCFETLDWLLNVVPANWTIYVNSENTPKYIAMWQLFNDNLNPINTPWITWFDDDIVTAPNWLAAAEQFIAANPQVALFGAQFWRPHVAGVEQWIRQARWYNSRPFHRRNKSNGIRFIRGSYWWLPTFVMRYLDWPDPRLSHNGGDTALSEAILQLGLAQQDFHVGTDTDFEPRRGYSECPAGCKVGRRKSDGKIASALGDTAAYDYHLKQHNVDYVVLTNTIRLVNGPPGLRPRYTNWGVRIVDPHATKLKAINMTATRRVRAVTHKQKRKSALPQARKLPMLLSVPHMDKTQVTTSYLSRKLPTKKRATIAHRKVKPVKGKTLKTLLAERQRRGAR